MNKIYEISELVGRRVRKGKVEYRVRWKGFPPNEDTWELGSNLRESCGLLIRMYNSQVRSKKELSHHSTTMTAYASQSLSPHASPPLKKTTALSECSSDQLSVVSATNCSPRSVSPALTASITPPIPAPLPAKFASESPPARHAAPSKGTKRSPGKANSSSSSSPLGGRKKVMVVFNSADGDSPPSPLLPPPPPVAYGPLSTAAKVVPKAFNRQLQFNDRSHSASGVAKERRATTAQEGVPASVPLRHVGKKVPAVVWESLSAANIKQQKRQKIVKKVIAKSKKAKEKPPKPPKGLKKAPRPGKAAAAVPSSKSKPPGSPLSPSKWKSSEPLLHQRQIAAAGDRATRSVPTMVVYALDRIKKMKRKSDMENIHELVSRMDASLFDKKHEVRKTVAAMERSGQLLRWEGGGGGGSFRVSARALEELHIDNSDGYLSVAADKHSPSRADAGKREAKKGDALPVKKRKAQPAGVKEADEPVLPLALTKRRKMVEESSEMSGSSSSLPPNDAAAKEGKSGNNSTHSSAGSTASGNSQSLVNKACNLIENIQSKSKTNAHVYLVGKHVLLVPPSSGGGSSDMSKQMSNLPHKRFGNNANGNGGNGNNGSQGPTTAFPGVGPSTSLVPPAGGASAYPIERRISVRQTESAFRFKEIVVRKHEGFVEIALQSNSGHLKNVFSLTTLNELGQALQAAIHDSDSRLVLLTGSDLAFSHGIDLNHVANCRSADAIGRYTDNLRSFLVSLANFPKPMVAAVNGPAIGLGAALLPLCDIVYASDKAHLQLPYCYLGQTPEGGSSFTLPHLVGSAVATDMFMSGRKLTAKEACERGLVSEVFWPSVLMQQVIPRCRRIAQCPPLSLESTKCIIRSQMREQLMYAIESECSMLSECWETNECKRKIQEFMNSTVDSIL